MFCCLSQNPSIDCCYRALIRRRGYKAVVVSKSLETPLWNFCLHPWVKPYTSGHYQKDDKVILSRFWTIPDPNPDPTLDITIGPLPLISPLIQPSIPFCCRSLWLSWPAVNNNSVDAQKREGGRERTRHRKHIPVEFMAIQWSLRVMGQGYCPLATDQIPQNDWLKSKEEAARKKQQAPPDHQWLDVII